MIILYVILAVVAVVIIWMIAVYNGLVGLKTRTDEAASDIDVQTKRRYDLINKLLPTVKGYAKHEQSVFENVTKARSAAMGANTLADKAAKENMLTDTLKSLFAVAENYPELKANVNFLDMQTQITETEDKIEASRRFYNGNVRDFNIKIMVFPNNMIANTLGFKKYDMYEASAAEKEDVKVDFDK